MKAALVMSVGLLALSGCASQMVSIRTVPAQTPAADSAAAAANAWMNCWPTVSVSKM